MPVVFIVVLVGLAGGMAVGVQGPLAGVISRHTGAIESAFIVHLVGAIGAGVILLLRPNQLNRWQQIPTYALFAGLLGIILVSSISYAIPRIGNAGTITLLVVGQLAIGIAIDHFGWLGAAQRPLDLSRVIGLVLLLIGVRFMVA